MRKLLSYIRLAIIDSFTYRGDMFLWAIGIIVQPVVLLVVWLAVINSGGKTPLSREEFVQYYIFLLVVRLWVQAWASQFISADIRLGRISPFILKPVPYLFFQLGNNFGGKILKSFFMVLVVIVLSLVFHLRLPSLSGLEVLIFFVSWFVAGIIYFLLDIIIGIAAFWFGDTLVLDEFVDTLLTIFSGMVIPLAAFPTLFQQISAALPFRYMLSFPIEVLLGHLTLTDLGIGLAIQIIWLLIFFKIYQTMWTRGLKIYSAVGA